jgi:phage-related baseplate assembly protein
VTLVILSRCAEANPHPSEAMCRAVALFVARRRPVAMEVHVTEPQYTVVTVDARVALARGADRNAVAAQARAALRQFFHPLSGGPDGNGWPIGRSVYRSEILALLDAIAGVDYVADLTLTADAGTPARCGDIAICPHGLVASGEHVITAV